MASKDSSDPAFNAFIAIIFLFSGIFGFSALISYMKNNTTEARMKRCESTGQVYDSTLKSCRDKTVYEQFDERCKTDVIVDGVSYACSQIRSNNLEYAYVNNLLTSHGNRLYQKGTAAEVEAGKASGDYCLGAGDTWSHIGEKRCVVFYYSYMACSNGYCFLNEKKDYGNGFVAFFGKYNMYSWDAFRATYYNNGPILVCGTIVSYRGHPEIKIVDVASQTRLSPTQSYSGSYIVYKYTCN